MMTKPKFAFSIGFAPMLYHSINLYHYILKLKKRVLQLLPSRRKIVMVGLQKILQVSSKLRTSTL